MYQVVWANGDASEWLADYWEAVDVAVKAADDTALIYEQGGYRPVWTWHQQPREIGDPREW